jgi:hypothetical protein
LADRWSLIVAIDRHLDPELGAVPFAESGARLVADALAVAGYPRERQFVLLGQQATRAVVGSRLRKLRKAVRKGDEVLVYWSGRGYSRGSAGLLACWDTQVEDPVETAMPVADLVRELTAAKFSRATLLLDVGAGPPPDDLVPHLDDGELESLLGGSEKAVALVAASAGEESHAAAALKASAWTWLVVEALSGRAGRVADRKGLVSAIAVQRSLDEELPRVLRRYFETGTMQTPRLFGAADAVIADLSGLAGSPDGGFLLDPDRLRRVLFRSETGGKVKDLAGWKKTFDLPTTTGPSARKFIARVSAADIRSELDAVHEAAREHLHYRRKDLDAAVGSDGVGQLRTPDFEYTVGVTLDPADPARVVWRREAGQFAEPGFLRGPGFDAVFGKRFDQLVFEFARPVDVEALVDRLEDRPPKGVKLTVASDGTSCDLTLAGMVGRITVDRHALTVRGRAGSAAGLLDQFLAFLRTVGPLGEPLRLPASH